MLVLLPLFHKILLLCHTYRINVGREYFNVSIKFWNIEIIHVHCIPGMSLCFIYNPKMVQRKLNCVNKESAMFRISKDNHFRCFVLFMAHTCNRRNTFLWFIAVFDMYTAFLFMLYFEHVIEWKLMFATVTYVFFQLLFEWH